MPIIHALIIASFMFGFVVRSSVVQTTPLAVTGTITLVASCAPGQNCAGSSASSPFNVGYPVCVVSQAVDHGRPPYAYVWTQAYSDNEGGTIFGIVNNTTVTLAAGSKIPFLARCFS